MKIYELKGAAYRLFQWTKSRFGILTAAYVEAALCEGVPLRSECLLRGVFDAIVEQANALEVVIPTE